MDCYAYLRACDAQDWGTRLYPRLNTSDFDVMIAERPIRRRLRKHEIGDPIITMRYRY